MIGGTGMMNWNVILGFIFAAPAAVYYCMRIHKEFIKKS